ncbi:MAG: extracellular solute-binding protein, partial [Oscillospiraceae bacterium]|nr:extracellular solute-binding protein [Oscillospiraceae bacterium]
MNNYVKFLTCIMIALLFISCQNENGTVNNKPDNYINENDNGFIDEPVIEEDDGYIPDDLPEMKFDGKTITFLSYGNGLGTWSNHEVVRETENGDRVNDAIYTRNQRIEERFDVNIKVAFNGDLARINTVISSGDTSYQAAWLDMSSMATGSQRGYFLNLWDVPYINLEKKYWDQSVVRDFSVFGKNYFATGDISTLDKYTTWIIMFNKPLVENYQLENPYTLVKNGDWTVAKFLEMMKNIPINLNGTDEWDENDQYGLSTTKDMIYGLYYGLGEKIVKKDSNDLIEFSYTESGLEKLQNILEITIEIMNTNHYTITPDDIRGGNWSNTMNIFSDNRALFYGEILGYVIVFRGEDIDFGIIPVPKYDKLQEDYISFSHPIACLLGVLLNCDDLSFTGAVIEAMAAESRR